jgi:hypothetical protein
MGAIKTTELSNGNIGLEITYGGKEAPFGGVDTSAPPAYIDPTCFTNCDGFIVVDNQLVAASLNPVQIPTLWSGTAGVILIGFGNFYTPKYGTLNYALGYTASSVSGTPTGVDYTFYMTAWVPGNPATFWNDTLNYTLFNSATPATKASLTINLETQGAGSPGTGATVNITEVSSLGTGASEPPGAASQFYLGGIVEAVTIAGGTGYAIGDTYWLVQGSNVTAQVTITAVSGIGAITGFTIVPNSYSVTYTNSSNISVTANTAGWGYSTGAATLTYSVESTVVLQIVGPGGTATYTVLSNGVAPVTPTLPGSGAALFIGALNDAGTIVPYYGGPKNATGSIYSIGVANNTSTAYPSVGGVNYSVGDEYYLDEALGYGVSNSPDPVTGGAPVSNPPTILIQGTAKVLITAVGAGGAITELQLIDSGLPTDGYFFNTTTVSGICVLNRPVPVSTVSSSPETILDDMAADINGLSTYPPDQNVTATVNISASSLTLTAIIAGTIGNSITAQDLSTITGPDLFYYYFPVRTATHLTGGDDGTNSGTVLSTVLPNKASIASVGGTLYIGNIGPAIIKYGGPGLFVTSTTLQGVRILKKFAGSLIGLGLIPAPGTVIASVDMIFAWSATDDLDTWAPLGLDGNVTGAGFAQLADIGDYLTGLIVTNATAFIIRSQGISYATATGNAASPFNFNHIGLGDEGEGAQVTALLSQYDQSGLYVGNSDVYQVANGISAVGAKIKTALFNALNENSFKLFGNTSCAVMTASETVLFLLAIGNVIYIYNPSNATWQTVTLSTSAVNLYSLALGVFASSNTTASSNLFNQCSPVVAIELSPQVYQFYELSEGVPNALSLSLPSSVTFPSEEVSFGRDITVDGIYSAISAQVSENVAVTYSLNGNVFSTQSLTPSEFDSLSTLPVETQIFSDSTTSAGAVTEHSPQLQISLAALPDTGTASVRLTKQAIFGSFDPKQRPV